MSDTLTTNLLLTDQSSGGNNNTWGTILNQNFTTLDAKLGNPTSLSTTGGSTTLSQTQELVAELLIIGSLASAATINFSGRGGFWIIYNNTSGAFSLTVKVTGQTGVVVPQGTSQIVFCNGTDLQFAVTSASASAEVAVASASTTDIGALGSSFVAISGTATIASLGSTGTNQAISCRATGAFKLTNSGSLICPGGNDITAVAGDTFLVVFDASHNVRIVSYQRTSSVPPVRAIGEVVDYTGPTVPPFFLFCYGQLVSRTTYALYFAVVGTTYGAGDGVTTFGMPDCRGRVTAGKDDMGGTPASRLTGQTNGIAGTGLGNVGGEERHQLTIAELAAHTHTGSPTGPLPLTASGPNTALSSAGASTGLTGSDTPHNNVQPTIIFNKMVFMGV